MKHMNANSNGQVFTVSKFTVMKPEITRPLDDLVTQSHAHSISDTLHESPTVNHTPQI